MSKSPLAFLACLAALMLTSCASYTIRRESVEMPAQFETEIAGRSIAVPPVIIKRGAKDMVAEFPPPDFDAPGIQGIGYQPAIGMVGLVAVQDILEETGLDFEALREELREKALAYLESRQDWVLPFFNGFGESNMGMISSRPYDYDRSVSPPLGYHVDQEEPRPLPAKVFAVADTASARVADLTLALSFSIEPEIILIVNELGDAISLDRKHPVAEGDLYFWLTGFFEFTLYENRTGRVIANQLSKSPFPVETRLDRYYYLDPPTEKPVKILTYVKTFDYAPFVREALGGVLETLCPLVDRYYKNTYHAVKIEK